MNENAHGNWYENNKYWIHCDDELTIGLLKGTEPDCFPMPKTLNQFITTCKMAELEMTFK